MRSRVLDFLRNSFPDSIGDDTRLEYRLLVSGMLHREIYGDWTKSDVARILLNDRADLLVASRPPDMYPQELALRFSCPTVKENYGSWAFMHSPDGEIAADLSALLTLFARRLVLATVKVREINPAVGGMVPAVLADLPMPVHGPHHQAVAHWPARAGTVITKPERDAEGNWNIRQEYKSHDPWPVPVQPQVLADFFGKVATQPDDLAIRIVAAARRYQQAMSFLPRDFDLSYQLLISAIETLSNLDRSGYTPSTEKIRASRVDLDALLKSYSLSEDQITRVLALIAREMPWNRDLFVRFIEKHLQPDVWSTPDTLYPGMHAFRDLIPTKETLVKSLTKIYRRRSARSHGGQVYPSYVGIGASPWITDEAFRALQAAAASERLPPLTWFERIVQSALVGFVMALAGPEAISV